MADDEQDRHETERIQEHAEIRHWQNNRFERRQRRTLKKYTDETGQVRPDSWRRGIESLQRMSVAPAPAAGVTGIVGNLWTQIGPQPLKIDKRQVFQGVGPDSGEVVDIAIDPSGTTDLTIYIATNDGGIWKTTDGGKSWTPKTEFMPSLSMGAVALDPDNASIVYAGTGNLFDGGGGGSGSVPGGFSKIADIYKSIDGGETWSTVPPSASPVGTFFSGQGASGINRIVVLPSGGAVLVATDHGLFRSTDGGLTFAEVGLGAAAVKGLFISDLSRDTVSPTTTVYASATGVGVFKSVDGGATFGINLFLTGAGVPKPGTPNSIAGGFGRVTFTQSTVEPTPANSGKTMYASVQGSPAGYKGLFKSSDGGGTWTQLPTGAGSANEKALEQGDQAGYDRTVGVDPQVPSRVYIAFQEMYVSTDGGTSFTKFSRVSPLHDQTLPSQIHWDHHALVFSPRPHWGAAPTRLYVGNDGGIATNPDGQIPHWKNLNGDPAGNFIATNLFNGIDIGRGSAANNVFTYGGSQDTGLSGHRPTDTGTDWHLDEDGDGALVVVDPKNPNNVYGSTNGFYVKSIDGGNNWTFPPVATTTLPACPPPNAAFSCAQPLAVDPNTSTVVYAASGSQLFQSTDGGTTFKRLPNLVTAANIVCVATTAQDSNRLWVGLSDGSVQFTTNALSGITSTWNAPPNSPGPAVQVGGIAIDPSKKDQVVVVYSGGGAQKRVLLTSNSGTSLWQDITGSIDSHLILNSVAIDSTTATPTIVVASIGGVLVTTDLGAHWNILGSGLPSVDCTSLAMEHRTGQPSLLRVGTYGRSVFELKAPTGPRILVKANLAFGVAPLSKLSPPLTVQIFNVGDKDLHVSSFSRSAGSGDFKAPSGPGFPATVPPGGKIEYTVRFQPSAGGTQTATYQIQSDDSLQPTVSVPASGSSVHTGTGGTHGTISTGHVPQPDILPFPPYEAPPAPEPVPPPSPEPVPQVTVPVAPQPPGSNTVAIVGAVGIAAIMGMVATAGIVAVVAINKDKS
jgi:photosystem II stability/assembly factor-like uncharacterized protein